MVKFINEPFDEEERRLMEAAESEDSGDERLPEAEELRLKNALREAAKNITIRIQVSDVSWFKERAKAAGLPYQTLINSVLHRYITGELVPKTPI